MNITQVHATCFYSLRELCCSCGPLGAAGRGVIQGMVFAETPCDGRDNKQKGLAMRQAFKKFGCGGRI